VVHQPPATIPRLSPTGMRAATTSAFVRVRYSANLHPFRTRRFIMDSHVYKTIQVTGTSTSSADDAVRTVKAALFNQGTTKPRMR